MKKLIVVIEVEMEKDVAGIETEICQRITMHPHVKDANPLSISESLESRHAPKPINVNYDVRGGSVSAAEARKIAERLAFNGGML
jgi:hypothetical protein